MHCRHFTQNTVGLGAAAVLLVLHARAASAAEKPSKRAICAPAYSAYKTAQAEEKAGHMRAARDALQTCAQVTSCAGLAPKCSTRYAELGAQMPSVVPVVTDSAGVPRTDIQVKVDGELLTSELNGKGVAVEPGVHEFSFATDHGVFATQKVMIVEGQHDRVLSVVLPGPGAPTKPSPVAVTTPSPAAAETNTAAETANADGKPSHEETETEKSTRAMVAPAPSPDRESPTARPWTMPRSAFPYVLGGAGLAAVAGGVLLTIWGQQDNSSLESRCKPACDPSSVDHIRTLYIAADLSFGVGAAALAVTTWLFAKSHAENAPGSTAMRIDVHPTASGAVASVSGTF